MYNPLHQIKAISHNLYVVLPHPVKKVQPDAGLFVVDKV